MLSKIKNTRIVAPLAAAAAGFTEAAEPAGRKIAASPAAVFLPPDYLDNPVTVRQQRQQGSLLLLPDSSAS